MNKKFLKFILSLIVSIFIGVIFYKLYFSFISNHRNIKNWAIFISIFLFITIYKILIKKTESFNKFWLSLIGLFVGIAGIGDIEYYASIDRMNESIKEIDNKKLYSSKLLYFLIHLGFISLTILFILHFNNSLLTINLKKLLEFYLLMLTIFLLFIIPLITPLFYSTFEVVRLEKKDILTIVIMTLFIIVSFLLIIYVFNFSYLISFIIISVEITIWFIYIIVIFERRKKEKGF